MKRRSRRLLKKLHKVWLGKGVIDASTNAGLRKRLFASALGEVLSISPENTEALDPRTAEAVRRYRLSYRVVVAPAKEAEPWLSEGGNILFKFWASDYPSIHQYSGNNPDIA